MKSKARPRKQRIKALLKRIAAEGGPRMVPLGLAIVDLLDDGQVNASILGMATS